jgi:hypothetical protein
MKILIENYRKWKYILILIVKNFTHYQINMIRKTLKSFASTKKYIDYIKKIVHLNLLWFKNLKRHFLVLKL